MGTLFNQQPRDSFKVRHDDIIDAIDAIDLVRTKCDLSFDQVMKLMEVLELRRRNNLQELGLANRYVKVAVNHQALEGL
jgi:hypothetical protein